MRETIVVGGANIIAGTDNGVFVSSDNGQSWKEATNSPSTALSKSGSNIVAGTNQGIFVSDDNGKIWT